MRGGHLPFLKFGEPRVLTFLGYLYRAVTDFTCSSLTSWSRTWDRNCGARTTKAFTTCSKDEGQGQERKDQSAASSPGMMQSQC